MKLIKLIIATTLLIFLTSCETFLVTVREVEKPKIEFKINMPDSEKDKLVYQITAKYLNELKTEYEKLIAVIKLASGHQIKVIDLSEKKE